MGPFATHSSQPNHPLSPANQGRLYTLAGVMILSFDSLLVRLIAAEPWTLIFWRGLLPALVYFAVQQWRDPSVLRKHAYKPTLAILLTGLLLAISTSCFVFSLSETQVASTLVLANTTPLITAVIAFVFLKEKLDIGTLLAIVLSVGGVMFIFGYAPSQSALHGDALALITASTMAIYLTMLRKTKAQYATVFLIYGGIFTALLALSQGAQPFSLEGKQWPLMFVLSAIVLPGAFLCINVGPRYLPAAETSLILLLEILFGPLWVWLILGNTPTQSVMMGAGLILFALVAQTLWTQRMEKKTH
ncbi:hypothetical protein VST7929_01450 [Vibrio stylophorae]|uniref:EamA domain-containing protein n=1 Tax=Vibrio stylophorae TaxID=659351 RepID=A0ABM8ZTD7_9VIBR|nr:DMT family transporter [Vibrio stylophorae]CAH0533580.1 hypothetical protein VST7929_01450 [Vibrio stylophorae]